MGFDMVGDQVDRALDASGAVAGRGDRVPDHRVQTAERLLDQRHAEVLRRAEVPVEGGRCDPDGAGDLAQTQAAQALLLQQFQRSVQERLTGFFCFWACRMPRV